MEAIAKHDFTATADDELSFKKNQVLKVWLSNFFPHESEVNLFGVKFFLETLLFADTKYGGWYELV